MPPENRFYPANCQCCKNDEQTVKDKKCPCWVFHYRECPWEEPPRNETEPHTASPL